MPPMDSPYCVNHNSPLILYLHLFDPTHIPHAHYRYKTLFRDDAVSEPLTETLFPWDIRPSPPKVYSRGEFSLDQAVDAFDNNGCWSGEITGRLGPHHYYVYFRTTNEEIAYPSNKIKVHHEWVNGDWILSQREQPQPQPLQN